MKKQGISLIVLVITIIVVIILAGAVIFNLSNNNPIENGKAASFLQEKESLESATSMFVSSQVVKTMGDYSMQEILAGKGNTDSLVTTSGIIKDWKTMYEVKTDSTLKNTIGIEPKAYVNAKWYLDTGISSYYKKL